MSACIWNRTNEDVCFKEELDFKSPVCLRFSDLSWSYREAVMQGMVSGMPQEQSSKTFYLCISNPHLYHINTKIRNVSSKIIMPKTLAKITFANSGAFNSPSAAQHLSY